MKKSIKILSILFVIIIIALSGVYLNHSQTIKWQTLNNDAISLTNQKEYEKAYLSAEIALKYAKTMFIPKDKNINKSEHLIGFILKNIGDAYSDQNKNADAEKMYEQSLAIYDKQLDKNNMSDVAILLNDLAISKDALHKYTEAEALYQRVLAIDQAQLKINNKENDSKTVITLVNLAQNYLAQNKYKEAQETYLRILPIYEILYGSDHDRVISTLKELAFTYAVQGKYSDASMNQARVLSFYQKKLGLNDPLLIPYLEDMVFLQTQLGKEQERIETEKQLALLRTEADK